MKYTFRPTLITSLLTMVLLSALINLGFWQLNRAEFKKLLKMQYFERSHTTLTAEALATKQENLRYYRIHLTGRYDNEHNILLDNKIVDHKVGYELLTPFTIFGSPKVILVDRGWIPVGSSRNTLPSISPIFGEQRLDGILDNIPAGGLVLGKAEVFTHTWPWRVSTIDLQEVQKQLHHNFYPYIIVNHASTVLPTNLKPEKHIAYAFQWFALAFTLLILFIVVSVKKRDLASKP